MQRAYVTTERTFKAIKLLSASRWLLYGLAVLLVIGGGGTEVALNSAIACVGFGIMAKWVARGLRWWYND